MAKVFLILVVTLIGGLAGHVAHQVYDLYTAGTVDVVAHDAWTLYLTPPHKQLWDEIGALCAGCLILAQEFYTWMVHARRERASQLALAGLRMPTHVYVTGSDNIPTDSPIAGHINKEHLS